MHVAVTGGQHCEETQENLLVLNYRLPVGVRVLEALLKEAELQSENSDLTLLVSSDLVDGLCLVIDVAILSKVAVEQVRKEVDPSDKSGDRQQNHIGQVLVLEATLFQVET